jgi:hypothetical protein
MGRRDDGTSSGRFSGTSCVLLMNRFVETSSSSVHETVSLMRVSHLLVRWLLILTK